MDTHEDLRRVIELRGPSDRSFGITFGVAFMVVAFWPLIYGLPVRSWALVIGGAFAVVALLRPSLLHVANRLWMRFGLFLSRIVNPIVMAAVFFLIFTPIGFFVRRFGHELLQLGFDRSRKSYWIERKPPGPEPQTMSLQF